MAKHDITPLFHVIIKVKPETPGIDPDTLSYESVSIEALETVKQTLNSRNVKIKEITVVELDHEYQIWMKGKSYPEFQCDDMNRAITEAERMNIKTGSENYFVKYSVI